MSKRTVTFVGGPLDGKTRELDAHQTRYEDDQPAPPEDIKLGEVPVGFLPPYHRYIYEESPAGSGRFVLKEKIEQ